MGSAFLCGTNSWIFPRIVWSSQGLETRKNPSTKNKHNKDDTFADSGAALTLVTDAH